MANGERLLVVWLSLISFDGIPDLINGLATASSTTVSASGVYLQICLLIAHL